MTSKKICFLLIVPLILSYSFVNACLCPGLNFCEFIKGEEKIVVVEATVLHHKQYLQNDAVYLRINKTFRDDAGISEVIKLYGNSVSADCHTNVFYHFKDGARIFLAIGLEAYGYDLGFDYVNPDAIYEDHWEFAPNSCRLIVLTVKEDKIFGNIAPDIVEYPFALFEQHLEQCDFTLEELDQYRCADDDFILYPNPSTDGEITIGNGYRYSSINKIRIFSSDGKLVASEEFAYISYRRTKIHLQYSGVYIVEIQCEEGIHYRRFIVQY